MAMEFLGTLATKAKNAITQRTDTQILMDECLSKTTWDVPATKKYQVAKMTNNFAEYGVIMEELWTALDHSGKNWRQIFKALQLLDFLIKHGSTRVATDSQSRIFRVQTLTSFSHFEEGVDQGAGVRKLSKELVELLRSKDRIREERAKAQELARRLYGGGGSGPGTTYGAPSAARAGGMRGVGSGGGSVGGIGGGGGGGGSDFTMGRDSRYGGASASRADHGGAGWGPEGYSRGGGSRPSGGGGGGAGGGRKPAGGRRPAGSRQPATSKRTDQAKQATTATPATAGDDDFDPFDEAGDADQASKPKQGKKSIRIRMTAGVPGSRSRPSRTVARVAATAPAPAPAEEDDDLDLFGPSASPAPAPAPAPAPVPAPTAVIDDDGFGFDTPIPAPSGGDGFGFDTPVPGGDDTIDDGFGAFDDESAPATGVAAAHAAVAAAHAAAGGDVDLFAPQHTVDAGGFSGGLPAVQPQTAPVVGATQHAPGLDAVDSELAGLVNLTDLTGSAAPQPLPTAGRTSMASARPKQSMAMAAANRRPAESAMRQAPPQAMRPGQMPMGAGGMPMGGMPMGGMPMGGMPMGGMPMGAGGMPMGGMPVGAGGMPMGGMPMGGMPMGGMPMGGMPMGGMGRPPQGNGGYPM